MKRFIIMAVAMASSTSWAQAVSKAKIAELSAHRVERLVTLGKIDSTFNTRLERIDATAVGGNPVAFTSLVSQTQPASGKPMQLQLSWDKDGKPLAYQVVAGGVAGPDPQWPDADAVTLAEDSLHYVLDNAATDPKILQFYNGFTFLVLTKGSLGGKLVSQAHIESTQTTDKLLIYLNTDGAFNSKNIVP